MESPADFPGRPEALQVRNENLGRGARWLPAPICCGGPDVARQRDCPHPTHCLSERGRDKKQIVD